LVDFSPLVTLDHQLVIEEQGLHAVASSWNITPKAHISTADETYAPLATSGA